VPNEITDLIDQEKPAAEEWCNATEIAELSGMSLSWVVKTIKQLRYRAKKRLSPKAKRQIKYYDPFQVDDILAVAKRTKTRLNE